ncbi:MAG: serine/threonine protein kinase [Elusimicrobia bacterium]|nr:serine/threonine protein kinase [Elusimicrobiota bacterium]
MITAGVPEFGAFLAAVLLTAAYCHRRTAFRVLVLLAAGTAAAVVFAQGSDRPHAIILLPAAAASLWVEWKLLSRVPAVTVSLAGLGGGAGLALLYGNLRLVSFLGFIAGNQRDSLWRISALPAAVLAGYAALRLTREWRAAFAGHVVDPRPARYLPAAVLLGMLGFGLGSLLVDSLRSAAMSTTIVLLWFSLGLLVTLTGFTQAIRVVHVRWIDCWRETTARRQEPAPRAAPRPPASGQPEPAAAPLQAKETRATSAGDGRPGTLLAGKYELLRRIGEGGMGVVYLGQDRTLGRPVAVKKMRAELRLNLREKNRFLAEAKTSASLHHPCIVDIYAVFEEADEVYLVFEYVDGSTLDQELDREGRLAWPRLKPVLKGVCDALSFAHERRVVHRDLKPSNIMVVRRDYAKVMDFGIARQMKDTVSRLTKADTSGTLAYMSPEQELGRCDARSDLYSLAVTLYELLTGELPFPGPNFHLQKERMAFKPLRGAQADVPADVAAAVERCLRCEPAERFQDAAGFARAAGLEA